ncbi:hypothetical protein J8273_2942 [Carpediemonas membranifera]|uniref:Uncharacterized protein n=1 Tax=Carpediemonas membranifera TaxID=201153 RepID=A0A8J6AY85_9EUKA|nr:hypothetical protein J8273_2942 [Carpediemonas membranifera]|eukprot:KAG9395375.1 hypothetical protein J8273_2942 [Carpediemonas membranifera]
MNTSDKYDVILVSQNTKTGKVIVPRIGLANQQLLDVQATGSGRKLGVILHSQVRAPVKTDINVVTTKKNYHAVSISPSPQSDIGAELLSKDDSSWGYFTSITVQIPRTVASAETASVLAELNLHLWQLLLLPSHIVKAWGETHPSSPLGPYLMKLAFPDLMYDMIPVIAELTNRVLESEAYRTQSVRYVQDMVQPKHRDQFQQALDHAMAKGLKTGATKTKQGQAVQFTVESGIAFIGSDVLAEVGVPLCIKDVLALGAFAGISRGGPEGDPERDRRPATFKHIVWINDGTDSRLLFVYSIPAGPTIAPITVAWLADFDLKTSLDDVMINEFAKEMHDISRAICKEMSPSVDICNNHLLTARERFKELLAKLPGLIHFVYVNRSTGHVIAPDFTSSLHGTGEDGVIQIMPLVPTIVTQDRRPSDKLIVDAIRKNLWQVFDIGTRGLTYGCTLTTHHCGSVMLYHRLFLVDREECNKAVERQEVKTKRTFKLARSSSTSQQAQTPMADLYNLTVNPAMLSSVVRRGMRQHTSEAEHDDGRRIGSVEYYQSIAAAQDGKYDLCEVFAMFVGALGRTTSDNSAVELLVRRLAQLAMTNGLIAD